MATNRRKFLKASALGAGALALAPSSGSVLAASANGEYPRRFVFIRKSNGNRPNEFTLPSSSSEEQALDSKKQAMEVDLDKHELPNWLRALDADKKHMTILHGLSVKMSEGGHWSYSSVMGAFKSGRNSLSGIKRATIDFELAKLYPSPFGHVELSLTGNYSTFRTGIVAGYSAPAPHQRNYCYADPQTAYNELFKSVIDPGGVDSENLMLKFLQDDEALKAQVLNGREKLKLSNHVNSLESIRQRNKKVETMSDAIKKHLPEIDKIHADGGLDANTPEKQEAMTDILIAALIAGLTNVVTYTIDELSTPIKGLPGNEGDHISLHELGHHGSYSGVSPEKIREQVRIGHIDQVAKIVKKLKSVPEGKGNMFDNTMIFYFPETGAGHHGPDDEAPFVIMSGDNAKLDIAGRYIRLPFHATEGHKTLGNWYTTLLNAHGNPIAHYGDLDLEMSRKKLAQTGAIKRFIV